MANDLLKLLRTMLVKAIDEIDENNCNYSENELKNAIDFMSKMVNPTQFYSKYQAANYLGVSRSTFNNYLKANKIPQGKKIQGMSSLIWYKEDLDKFKYN